MGLQGKNADNFTFIQNVLRKKNTYHEILNFKNVYNGKYVVKFR
jgi:hypothetical protein